MPVEDWKANIASQKTKLKSGLLEPATAKPRPSESIQNVVDWLEEMKRRDPVQWAVRSRQCYLTALRCGWPTSEKKPAEPTDAEPSPLRLLATCQHNVNLFAHWEQGLVTQGFVPARNTEKALRWDEREFFSKRQRI